MCLGSKEPKVMMRRVHSQFPNFCLDYSKSTTYESSSFKPFKVVNVHSHVQSRKFVHVSGLHCCMPASSTTGCASVYFTELYRVQYTVSLFQAQDVQKEA